MYMSDSYAKWYSNLDVVIKWDDCIHYSTYCRVTCGTRQGNIISPVLFNLFMSGLILELSLCEHGVPVGNHLYISFAYADDVSLFSITVPDLHKFIDICTHYLSYGVLISVSKRQIV